MMDNKQQADRLKALWKSGRDKYRSFFVVLNEVRQEIGDEALASWCFDELSIGFSVITKTADILNNKIDTAKIKADLAAASRAEKPRARHDADKLRAAERRIAELETALARRPSATALGDVGRPLNASEVEAAKVRKLRKAGVSLRGIAASTGLGVRTVRTILDRA
jgi:hypothetical protein